MPAEAATCAEFIPVSLMALTDRRPSSSMRIFDAAFWCLLIARSKQVKPEINERILYMFLQHTLLFYQVCLVNSSKYILRLFLQMQAKPVKKHVSITKCNNYEQ